MVHLAFENFFVMDCRVKPGNDDRQATALRSAAIVSRWRS